MVKALRAAPSDGAATSMSTLPTGEASTSLSLPLRRCGGVPVADPPSGKISLTLRPADGHLPLPEPRRLPLQVTHAQDVGRAQALATVSHKRAFAGYRDSPHALVLPLTVEYHLLHGHGTWRVAASSNVWLGAAGGSRRLRAPASCMLRASMRPRWSTGLTSGADGCCA